MAKVKNKNISRVRTHPGEMLREEFVTPHKYSVQKLAEHIGIPLYTFQKLIAEEEVITDEIATKLSDFFGNTKAFWLNLQENYDNSIKC